MIFINPKVWHASFAREENSKALVLRFSDSAFKSFLKKDEHFIFDLPPSNSSTRNEAIYRRLRYFAALLLTSMGKESPFQKLTSKASFEMLLSALCESSSQAVRSSDPNRRNRETMQRMLRYIDQHCAEKLSLDDIGQYTHYNRTYVSTLFKNTVGINFHDYLTKIRLSNAIFQLAVTEKNMTQIAIDCGFSDLKTFNHRFREIFGYLPAEYKQRLSPIPVVQLRDQQIYVSPDDGPVREKLREFLSPL